MTLSSSPVVQVTAIIPTRGRLASLHRTLDSIRRQNFASGYELIVVDDASEPPLQALPGDVKVLRFERNVGACVARNAGARAARGELLLFMDDDAEIESPNVLAAAVDWFAKHSRLGAVGFRQLRPNRQVHNMQPAVAEVPVRTGLFFSYGCVVPRRVYEAIGGMNEAFGYYHEEVEFSLKLYASGYDVIYDPTLMVIHHEDGLHRNVKYIRRQSARNACLSYLIHYPAWMLPALMLKRLHLYARLGGGWFPGPADIWWFAKELFRQRDYVWQNRKSLGWSVVRGFHSECGKAEPISTDSIGRIKQ